MIGIRGVPINEAVFLNNFLPALVGIAGCALFQQMEELLISFVSWRTFLFALLVQAVGYSFSLVLRAHPVERAVLLAKSSDLPIFVMLFPVATQFGPSHAIDAALSGATTIICVVYLLRTGRLDVVQLALPVTLVFQGLLSPFLSPDVAGAGIVDGLIFAIATMAWRTLFSLPKVTGILVVLKMVITDGGGLVIFRAVLAVVVQVSFVIAISALPTALIWSLLNMSGALSLLFARFVSRPNHSFELDAALVGIVSTTACRLALDAWG